MMNPIMNIFNKNVVTLNIDSDSIKVMQVGKGTVKKYGETSMPTEVYDQGYITDPKEVSKVISDLFDALKISRKNVIASMNCFRSVSRFLTLPPLNGRKLKEAVKWAAERELPVALDTMNIWWQVIEKTKTEQKVLMLAVPREALAALYTTLYYAGVSPKAIDMKAIALARIAGDDDAIVADMEGETISLILKANGMPVMMRSVIVKPENSDIDDQVYRLNDELRRTMDYFNMPGVEKPSIGKTPCYVTGRLIDDEIVGKIRETTGCNIIKPEMPFSFPEGFHPGTYAVNAGLYLREVKSRRSILHPDISRAVRFKL